MNTGIDTADSADAMPLICIVGPLPPPSGGMGNQCEQLVRLLREDRVSVSLVRTNAHYWPAWLGRVPGIRAIARLIPYLVALWKSAGRVQVMHVLANSGWAWHLFAAPAIWIARVRHCPVIVNYHGGNAGAFFKHAPAHVFRTLKCADARVVPSTFLQRVFAQSGIDAEVVPNIIDLSRFKPVPMRDFGMGPHLIVTRNLEPIYDIATAIRAFAEVRKVFGQARMTVAGTGPELEHLIELGESLGLAAALTFSGRIENSDIPTLYASADCMLNPSTVDNMPISILEALASGVPVVSTDAGGIPDMVEHGVSALLVPIGKPEEMARETIRILSDRSLAETQRAAGLAEVARYAWPRVREQWFAVYRRVAAGRSSHSAAATPAGKAT